MDDVDEYCLPRQRGWMTSVPKTLANDDLSFFRPLPLSCLHAAEDLTVTRSPTIRSAVAMSGTRGRTTFPSDKRAGRDARGGASAPGARSPRSAHRPPEPLPGDGVGGARNLLATANRPMQHSQAPPDSGSSRGAQCSTEAAPREGCSAGRGGEGPARASRGALGEGVAPADPACGAERLQRGG